MGSTLILFSAEQAAAALWRYGEDTLVEPALALTEDDLRKAWEIAGSFWKPNHTLPLKTRLVSDKAIAFACMELIEGRVRPLAQERRRAESKMPEHLRNARPLPPGTMP